MTERRKTTSEHFELFKAEASACLKRWGINDLGVMYHHGKRDARASFFGKHTKRIATIVLSTEWEEFDEDNPVTAISDDEIKSAARHECIHALLLPLAAMVASYCTQDEAEAAEEGIVRRLQDLLP